MIQKNKGLLAILSANTIFGLNIPVTKTLIANWMSPLTYTATRMVFGALIFWIISIFLKQEKVKKLDLLVMLIGGLMGYLGTQLSFSQSLKFTSPVVFSLLMALTPVVVILLSVIFLKEHISSRKIIGMTLSIAGAALIVLLGNSNGMNGANNLLGIFYAIICVLAYSGYLIITRTISAKYAPVTIAKYMFLISALLVIPFSYSDIASQKIYSQNTNIMAISLLAFALLFSTTLAFFLMPYALKRLEASTVSTFMNLQPIVASVIAIFVGQDVLSWEKPVAIVLVISGVSLVTIPQKNEQKRRVISNNWKVKRRRAS